MDSSSKTMLIGGIAAGTALGLALAHGFRPSWCGKTSTSGMTLMYFNGRGLAEVARQMLAVAGVDYTDKRYHIHVKEGDGPLMSRFDMTEMEADKVTGMFDANIGRMPVLDHNGTKIGGSKAIYRYIARTCGLMGSSELEAGQIDTICEIMWDIADDFGKKQKEEEKEKWFSVSEKEGGNRGDRQFKWYLAQLEKCVGADGFAVGGKSSMADAVIYSKFGETCTTQGLFGSTDSQPMGSTEKVQQALNECAPKIAKIVKNFGTCPAMKEYFEKRAKNTQQF